MPGRSLRPEGVDSCGLRERGDRTRHRSPVTRRERRLRLPGAAADRDFAAPVQPETGQRRPESPEIPANALLAQLVEHFHGKEGVVGSSPTEGFPCNSWAFWHRGEGRSRVCASTSRPKCVHLRRGRQTRIARICGMERVVDHFLPAVRSCPLDARQSWRARGIAVEAGGSWARDSAALSRTRKASSGSGCHATDLAHQSRRCRSICGSAHMDPRVDLRRPPQSAAVGRRSAARCPRPTSTWARHGPAIQNRCL